MVYHVGMKTSSGIEIPTPPVPSEEEKYQMTLEAIEGTSKGRKGSSQRCCGLGQEPFYKKSASHASP